MGIEVYIFAVFVLIILGCVYAFHLKEKYQKAVVGHVYATFLTKTGARIDELCRVDGNKVIPPTKLFSSNPAATIYLIRSDKTHDISYPPHYPSFVQSTVRTIVYGEGNPEPFDPTDKPPILTDKLVYNLTNELATGLAMKGMNESLRADELMTALENAGGGNKTLLYVCIGIIAIVGLLGFFVFQLSGQVGDLLSLYGL